ncbi:DUF4440 domain-containing protein [Robiginitalea sp. SC105]|uniref:YybH family protein n=1 Tax=Robiginitalea sp. SC105 TaxID=2762332 RepID=UPI00163A379A|nr:nuclear transport factor 2 family protein [Robiginitalea sp. SC105]MBC2838579.1 nuclear transport factor 2 family protein [Robiginitalea sp. SC105]
MNKRILPLIIMLGFLGCMQEKPGPVPTMDQTALPVHEKEIESRIRQYERLLEEGDSVGLGAMYTEDAEIIPSTTGRDAIIRVIGSMVRDSITGSHFQTTGLWGDDQLLVEEGTGTWSHANGTVVSRGRYLLVWVKRDGEWKILRDTWFPADDH